MPPSHPAAARRRGFTLVESLVAMSIAAIAASALYLGIASSRQTTEFALDETIAAGLAEQLLDEILGARYAAVGVGGYQSYLGPSGWEQGGVARERYDDIDDYHNFAAQPPVDRWGIEPGSDDGAGATRHPAFRASAGLLDGWRREVEIYYVDESDPTVRLPGGQTSGLRAVEVRVLRDTTGGDRRPLATARRVVAYVEEP